MTKVPTREVQALARRLGVQSAYYDVNAQRVVATRENLLAAIRALGAPVTSLDDVPRALELLKRDEWERAVDPVIVAWLGAPVSVELRIPERLTSEGVRCTLHVEGSDCQQWDFVPNEAAATRRDLVSGESFVAMRLPLPEDLPIGYHNLSVELGVRQFDSLVICAPARVYQGANRAARWGVSAPVYGLRSRRDWGVGDYSCLRTLVQWTAEHGGSVVATLPLLAAYYTKPFEHSPYAPASRLHWNELYIDVSAAPELAHCPEARNLIASPQVADQLTRMRASDLVDYPAVYEVKRRVLEKLAQSLSTTQSERRIQVADFSKRRDLETYAKFRAVCDREAQPWQDWPARQRDGLLRSSDYDENDRNYHVYVQWLAEEQLRQAVPSSDKDRACLQLDLPLGTHVSGYDVWRERTLFSTRGSVGAPPDTFFQKGQNWGFRLVNPKVQRDLKYGYFIKCLQHHMRHAGSLRIDHVMGFHRLFFISEPGMDAKDGVYVQYPAEELYAILCLESHRHHATIVGEDLGTVPRSVRTAMSKYGLQRSYVLQIEPGVSRKQPFGHIPRRSVASLNTHDTPSFAAFWTFSDIDDRLEMGLISEASATSERDSRREWQRWLIQYLRSASELSSDKPPLQELLQACLTVLGSSKADRLLVGLEDLWLEPKAQNVPGTHEEHPNWRRKLERTLEEIDHDYSLSASLTRLSQTRSASRRHAA